jgi:cytochrome c oxidase cbb3-type subunit I
MTNAPPPTELAPSPAKQQYALERALIDESARLPVLMFFGTSLFWLLVGTVLAIIASTKLHSPTFLDGSPWLTFGRVRPAHLNAVNYGWAALASFGMLLWLMARLARSPIRYPGLLVIACVVWNIGVFAGVVSILAGYGTGIEWLEFPSFVPPILVAAYAFIATWALATFRLRREHHVYVTQWYMLGALFWFPWLYTVANLLLFYAPVKGVTQATVNWWFAHNWLGLWLTPIGVGAAYYLIPKVYGRPVYSYYLSILGFWALALFYNWAGMHHLVGGPIPAWLIAATTVGSMMMLIPVAAVAVNHHMTAFPKFSWEEIKKSNRILWASPTLRFIIFGAVCYTMVSVQGAFQALPIKNRTTHFTHYTIAHAHLGLYGFFSMMAFGSMYYIVPRLTGWEWASSRLIKTHFWCVAGGMILYFVGLTLGGWYQGDLMNYPKDIIPYGIGLMLTVLGLGALVFFGAFVVWEAGFFRSFVITLAAIALFGWLASFLMPHYPRKPGSPQGLVPFIEVVKFTVPYLTSRTVAGIVMGTGHVAFVVLFVLNVMRKGERREGPTLLDVTEQREPAKPQAVGAT